jgi:hypothetical protein
MGNQNARDDDASERRSDGVHQFFIFRATGFVGSESAARVKTESASVVAIAREIGPASRGLAAVRIPLSASFHGPISRWLAFGFPAFVAVFGILWLMIIRPDISL